MGPKKDWKLICIPPFIKDPGVLFFVENSMLIVIHSFKQDKPLGNCLLQRTHSIDLGNNCRSMSISDSLISINLKQLHDSWILSVFLLSRFRVSGCLNLVDIVTKCSNYIWKLQSNHTHQGINQKNHQNLRVIKICPSSLH